ncbi:MAG: hypothetical protein K8H74_18010 [Notoacmeibacter sp.]|nr:hypothetical protein [Notoacmeibacter sp.]
MTSIQQIKQAAAAQCGFTVADIESERRTRALVRARQMAMFVSKRLTPKSLPQIGRAFGGRDHTTVLHAVRKIDAELSRDPALAAEVEIIIATALTSITPETEQRLDHLAELLVDRIVERLAEIREHPVAERLPEEKDRDAMISAALDVVLCDRALDSAVYQRGEKAARERLDRSVKRLRVHVEGRA